MNDFKPSPSYTIQDLQTLRVIADPLHTQIYETLVESPLTIKQVGERLGLTPGKLYYHFNLMEKHGLIKVVKTRTVSNIIEKFYWVIAEDLEVDDSLLSFTTDEGKESIQALLASTIGATHDDLIRSLEARQVALDQGAQPRDRRIIINRHLSRITDERAAEFRDRLLELIKEFAESDQKPSTEPGDDRQAYGLLVALYPNFYYPDEQDKASE
jgi:DNA-binding transcriptional ArsR family regulator